MDSSPGLDFGAFPDVPRIRILGPSGSGKSTLASQLGKMLGIVHHEMDAYCFLENWTRRNREERNLTLCNLADPRSGWVMDGDYGLTNNKIFPIANVLICLHYPWYIQFWRLFLRSIRRIWSGEHLWGQNGTQETFFQVFFSRDSGLYCAMAQIRATALYLQKSINVFKEIGGDPKIILTFKHPSETEAWFQQLEKKRKPQNIKSGAMG